MPVGVEKDIRAILSTIQNLTEQVLLFGKNLLSMQTQLDFLSSQNARHDERITRIERDIQQPPKAPDDSDRNALARGLLWLIDRGGTLAEGLKLWHLLGSGLAFGAWALFRHIR